MLIQGTGIVLCQHRHRLHMRIAHIAECKVDAPEAAPDRHRGNCTFAGEFSHTVAVAAR